MIVALSSFASALYEGECWTYINGTVCFNGTQSYVQLTGAKLNWSDILNPQSGSGSNDGNNYTNSISFSNFGNTSTLTLGRVGMSSLTATMIWPFVSCSSGEYSRWNGSAFLCFNDGGDGNNYPTSLAYTGRTLTLGRNGLSDLTANIPDNSTLVSCSNITGATSNLCTITQTTDTNDTARVNSINESITQFQPSAYTNISNLQAKPDATGGWTNTTTYTSTSLFVNLTQNALFTRNITFHNSTGAALNGFYLTDGGSAINTVGQLYSNTILSSGTQLFTDGDVFTRGSGGDLWLGASSQTNANVTMTPRLLLFRGDAGGINTTYLTVQNLNAGASCDVKATANGTIYCGTDSSGSATNYAILVDAQYNVTNQIWINRTEALTISNNLQNNITSVNASSLQVSTAISTYVNRSLWTTIDNYPTGCGAGQYVITIGDTLTCSTPTGTNNAITLDAGFNLTNVFYGLQNKTTYACQNITGAVSNLCTITSSAGNGGWFNDTIQTNTTLLIRGFNNATIANITFRTDQRTSSIKLPLGQGLLIEDDSDPMTNYTQNAIYHYYPTNFTKDVVVANLTIKNLTSASCDVKADVNGVVYCGTDATGSGSVDLAWMNTTKNTTTNITVYTLDTYYQYGNVNTNHIQQYFCDFMTAQAVTMCYPNYFGAVVGTGGASATYAGNTTAPGVVSLSIGTAANSGYRYQTEITAFLLNGSEYFSARLSMNTTNQNQTWYRLGFCNSVTTGTECTNAVSYNITNLTVTAFARNAGGTSATVANFNLTAGIWYTFTIQLNSNATNANFTIYNDSRSQLYSQIISSNIPVADGRTVGSGIVGGNQQTNAPASVKILLDYLNTEIRRPMRII